MLENKRKEEIKIEPVTYIRIERDSIAANFIQEESLRRKFSRYSFLSDVNDIAVEDNLNIAIMQEFCIKTNKPQNYQSLNRIELGERLNVFSPYNIKGKI